MAQLNKGKRDTSTFAVPFELKGRIEVAGERHGYTQPGVYLADLISALHPEPRQPSETHASLGAMIPMLLGTTQVPVSSERHVFTFRTPVGVKPRIKAAYKAYGYARMTAYLVDVMSALHPPQREDHRGESVHAGHTLTPEAAHSLVSSLLNDSHNISITSGPASYEQQAFLDLYDLERPQQTAA
ncbi:hypothetical protein [Nonomuraea aurantiaca]|uniref:hypothetical protein n=1 Tax=Nonomuraea aurantiaca TaxID=2878562 RepID=UPI001CD92127|nr:hypothetical protein [Nonomuraea aurantiaca]MCA2228765.1 hypothetical protein [Nonomuraea aurantiaca]